ncbi:MAG: hypothetical protein HYU64_12335 [Armatimonadetes bacterium]|nr:hypothetical protein [Armatimonadota bacterium]
MDELFPQQTDFTAIREKYVQLAERLEREALPLPPNVADLMEEVRTLSRELTPENYALLKRPLRTVVYKLCDKLNYRPVPAAG